MIAWDVVKIESAITVSAGGIVETNYTFSLLDHPQQSSWAALFDQWCIPQATITFRSELPPGSLTIPAILVTALDFDSVGAVGSVVALDDFSTAAECTMGTGATMVRSVKPCVKFSTGQAGANVNSGMSTPWVDSGATGTLHYGIRSIVTQSNVAYNLVVTKVIWYAFRNQI